MNVLLLCLVLLLNFCCVVYSTIALCFCAICSAKIFSSCAPKSMQLISFQCNSWHSIVLWCHLMCFLSQLFFLFAEISNQCWSHDLQNLVKHVYINNVLPRTLASYFYNIYPAKLLLNYKAVSFNFSIYTFWQGQHIIMVGKFMYLKFI